MLRSVRLSVSLSVSSLTLARFFAGGDGQLTQRVGCGLTAFSRYAANCHRRGRGHIPFRRRPGDSLLQHRYRD